MSQCPFCNYKSILTSEDYAQGFCGNCMTDIEAIENEWADMDREHTTENTK
jgi:coproporphyrinogen III oxidase-like Fe-S oxidoreductase